MRTTLVIEDRLFRRAKEHAAKNGITLSDLVSQALRALLAERPVQRPNFAMTTYGRGAERVLHEPADLAEEMERDDTASLGRS